MRTVLTFCLIVIGATSPGVAQEHPAHEAASCAIPGLSEFSAKEMQSRLVSTQPIEPLRLGHKVRLRGVLILHVAVGADGEVICAESISGHPLILGAALHSVSGWKFRPYLVEKQQKPFHGKLAIKYNATERTVTFRVIGHVPVTAVEKVV